MDIHQPGGYVMGSVIKPLGWVLVGIMLKQLLDPVLGPVVGPALPTAGELILSTLARTNEALFTTAIRYTAAGYREPGDVLLTLVSLLMLIGVVIGGAFGLSRLPRPVEPPRKRHILAALVILVALGLVYLFWAHTTELSVRTMAMQMYKSYERNMAVLAPYISSQEARELGSSWARMETGADLQAMDERFRALLQQHGLISQ
jgi:hypothetical protein